MLFGTSKIAIGNRRDLNEAILNAEGRMRSADPMLPSTAGGSSSNPTRHELMHHLLLQACSRQDQVGDLLGVRHQGQVTYLKLHSGPADIPALYQARVGISSQSFGPQPPGRVPGRRLPCRGFKQAQLLARQ